MESLQYGTQAHEVASSVSEVDDKANDLPVSEPLDRVVETIVTVPKTFKSLVVLPVMEHIEPSLVAVYVLSHLKDQGQAVVSGGSMVGHQYSCTSEVACKSWWTVSCAPPRKPSDDCKCLCMCFDVVEPPNEPYRPSAHAS